MARSLPLILCVLCLSSCQNEDPPPLYFQADYVLRCGGCTPLVPDEPRRNIELVDGEDGATLACSVEDVGGRRLLTFTFVRNGETMSDRHGFVIRQIDLDGSSPGNACRVRAIEGSNTYDDRCKAPDDDGDAKCEIEVEADGETVTGKVYCNDFSDGETGYTRDLVKPGSSNTPVEFEIYGCSGL
jgi:hypothetical protein